MDGLAEFLTQSSFWWGAILGAVISGGITYVTKHRSDTRNFRHEENLAQKQADREQEERNKRTVFEAATNLASVCTEVLTNSIDEHGVFNAIRDLVYQDAGQPDPKTIEKMMFAKTQLGEFKRVAEPMNVLKLSAPEALITEATKLTSSLQALLAATTQPLAKPVLVKAAGDQLNQFINTFRTTYGQEAYTESKSHEDAMSFMETLERQIDQYFNEAKEQMKAAGFKTTPWD